MNVRNKLVFEPGRPLHTSILFVARPRAAHLDRLQPYLQILD